MYSLTPDIENTEFNGWLNPEILLKNTSRRQPGSRKRGYDLTNIDLSEECEDLRRRVLRPRHDSDLQNTPEASRTRPIRSNRARTRPVEPLNDQTASQIRLEQPCAPPISSAATSVPDIALPQSGSDLSLLQALAAYNWSQNYFLSHTDPSFLHRFQQATYHHNVSNVHLSQQRIPQFDPWVLHNYLLAASYSAAGTSHVTPDTANDDAALRMSQMAFPSMASEISRNNAMLWQYPFLLNQPQARSSHDLHHHSAGSAHMESHSDLSYYLRFSDYLQRDSVPTSNDGRLYQGMYPNDPRISNYCNPIIPNPFTYGSVCPYHLAGHLLHPANQSSSHIAGSGSTQSEPAVSQSQNTLNSFSHSTGVTFDQFWPHMTPTIRPLNYSLNGSNIDTLLHLAAHFEQRKRGITREELDKLPTHRYKAMSDKQKLKEKTPTADSKITPSDDVLKCLVCLDDFEPKQNIRSLRCDHEFHAKCIDKWLKINRTCPLCRADAFDGTAQKDVA